jgi:hypothetical protein
MQIWLWVEVLFPNRLGRCVRLQMSTCRNVLCESKSHVCMTAAKPSKQAGMYENIMTPKITLHCIVLMYLQNQTSEIANATGVRPATLCLHDECSQHISIYWHNTFSTQPVWSLSNEKGATPLPSPPVLQIPLAVNNGSRNLCFRQIIETVWDRRQIRKEEEGH